MEVTSLFQGLLDKSSPLIFGSLLEVSLGSKSTLDKESNLLSLLLTIDLFYTFSQEPLLNHKYKKNQWRNGELWQKDTQALWKDISIIDNLTRVKYIRFHEATEQVWRDYREDTSLLEEIASKLSKKRMCLKEFDQEGVFIPNRANFIS